MAVTVDITSAPLSREESGATFQVSNGNGQFGELIVSKGGLRWRPKGAHDHHFMTWRQVDEVACKYPKK